MTFILKYSWEWFEIHCKGAFSPGLGVVKDTGVVFPNSRTSMEVWGLSCAAPRPGWDTAPPPRLHNQFTLLSMGLTEMYQSVPLVPVPDSWETPLGGRAMVSTLVQQPDGGSRDGW